MKRKTLVLLTIAFAGMSAIGSLNAAGDAEAAKAKVPLCIGCHGAQGEGKEPAGEQPAYPKIAGQIEAYLVTSVQAYKDDKRVDPVMGAIAKGLTDADIANLAAYYAGLGK